jgi:hypothetical protein
MLSAGLILVIHQEVTSVLKRAIEKSRAPASLLLRWQIFLLLRDRPQGPRRRQPSSYWRSMTHRQTNVLTLIFLTRPIVFIRGWRRRVRTFLYTPAILWIRIDEPVFQADWKHFQPNLKSALKLIMTLIPSAMFARRTQARATRYDKIVLYWRDWRWGEETKSDSDVSSDFNSVVHWGVPTCTLRSIYIW